MDTHTAGITVGYKASAEQFGPRELVELAVLAEARGFDSVMVSDHYQPWRHRGGHAPFSMAWLAAVGERTERVRLGTSVLTATFRYNPAVVAQAFGTLGALYPGRIVLGLGTGEALNEVSVGREEWPGFRDRFARLREAIDLIRRLWTEDRVSFDGEYYRTENATVYDRPPRPVPLYVAAGGPVVAKFAGRVADGFICTSGKGMELYTEKLQPAVDAGAEQAGRKPADVVRSIEIKVSYDTDASAAVANTRFWAPLSLTAEQKHGISDPVDMERVADELPMTQVASRWIVSADPDEVVARIRPYVDAGFTDLVLHAPGGDQARFLELARKDLLPRLRALA
ncbi:glucose-6-phosphate dehydrogenase (coenzyme-F420) [Amycolatopsis thermoflava]|uniref:glucose-6-phosphate dehydrogenase (coenzyme-F420) n=1 Tax=Amycolatopsis thermoflava TaxID=84480 RepID=UPI0036514E3F